MKILLLLGHPNPDSYNAALAKAYADGAKSAGHEIRQINVAELEFIPNLQYGYRKRTELEPDLITAQETLKWADHWVFVYPVWWGQVPALMKGFLDRVLLPGFAFQKKEGSLMWHKYCKGKSGRIICTMDQPAWYYRLYYGHPSTRAIRDLTMKFVGVSPVKVTSIGPVRLSKDEWRNKWLDKVKKLGTKGQ